MPTVNSLCKAIVVQSQYGSHKLFKNLLSALWRDHSPFRAPKVCFRARCPCNLTAEQPTIVPTREDVAVQGRRQADVLFSKVNTSSTSCSKRSTTVCFLACLCIRFARGLEMFLNRTHFLGFEMVPTREGVVDQGRRQVGVRTLLSYPPLDPPAKDRPFKNGC